MSALRLEGGGASTNAMNYRHAYHAGNFAHVLKHAALALILQYMTAKPQPLRVIDVHAGIGSYDLDSVEAGKTGEWQGGIGRVFGCELPPEAAALLAPYLDAVAALNGPGQLRRYPGSPLLARALLVQERYAGCQRTSCGGLCASEGCPSWCAQTKALNLDAGSSEVAVAAAGAARPYPDRSAVRSARRVRTAFGGAGRGAEPLCLGTHLIWYPIKDTREVSRFLLDVRGLGLKKVLNVTLAVCARGANPGLTETGLLIVNPPYVLAGQLGRLLPIFCTLMGSGPGRRLHLERLAGLSRPGLLRREVFTTVRAQT